MRAFKCKIWAFLVVLFRHIYENIMEASFPKTYSGTKGAVYAAVPMDTMKSRACAFARMGGHALTFLRASFYKGCMPTALRLALYQPDMPTNTGALLRLGACLGVGLDIIEPCGFIWDDKRLRRVAMDYIERVAFARHADWAAFRAASGARRLVLLTTKAAVPYTAFAFRGDDILLTGRESAGVPDDVHAACDARVVIPMAEGLRSLNVASAAAMALGEALRQTGPIPPEGR